MEFIDKMDYIINLDNSFMAWLNQWAGDFFVLDFIVYLLVSDYLIPIIFSLTLFSLWFWDINIQTRTKKQLAVLQAIAALSLSNLTVFILSIYITRMRPFMAQDLNLLFYQPTDPSFPSNPTATAFAIAHSINMANKKLGICAYILSSLWGLSRLFAGINYFSDIVAGAIIGILISHFLYLIFQKIPSIPFLFVRFTRFFHLG